MLLRDLVDAPRLRLRLLLEPPGALDRPVRRALTTDLLEPTRYLSGGELVLTGLNWRRSAADSETFVRSLVDGGAIALAAGDALLGSVPADLVEACRRHGLPLLEVPEEISFADLVEHCAAATGSPAGARMSASLVRQREMLSAIASGRTLDEVAARVSAGTGRSVRVLTTTGRCVVPGREPLAETDVDRVVHAYLAAARLPVTVGEGATALTAFPVGSVLGSRLASWLVVVGGEDPGVADAEDVVETVEEFASIAALDRSRRAEGLRGTRRIAEDLLALVEAGGGQRELEVRLEQAGADSAALVAVVAGLVGRATRRRWCAASWRTWRCSWARRWWPRAATNGWSPCCRRWTVPRTCCARRSPGSARGSAAPGWWSGSAARSARTRWPARWTRPGSPAGWPRRVGARWAW